MKQLYLFLLLLINITGIAQQQRDECGTPEPKIRLKPDADAAKQLRTMATYPLLIKVFVHVFANNDGTSVAAGDSSIMRQLKNMQQFYAPQGICFILAGYEQINNTDLNSHNADTEEGELAPYLVPNMMNVFVHDDLFSNDGGLNGTAYGIPNYYLSISRGAITSASNRSTLAHEMGHDFGLYHTFQARTTSGGSVIRENVARSGGCKNCEDEGDLLCDTKADRNIDDDFISATTCNYTGSATDACGATLQMETTNIMTYGRRACRSIFTNGQGNRAEAFILTTAYLTNAIAADDLLVNSNVSSSSGKRFYLARNSVTINTALFSMSGSTVANISANRVTLHPGVTLSPSGTGYSEIKVNTLCQ